MEMDDISKLVAAKTGYTVYTHTNHVTLKTEVPSLRTY